MEDKIQNVSVVPVFVQKGCPERPLIRYCGNKKEPWRTETARKPVHGQLSFKNDADEDIIQQPPFEFNRTSDAAQFQITFRLKSMVFL